MTPADKPIQPVLLRCSNFESERYWRRRERNSRERFGGNREQVLERDEHRCPLCGSPERRKLVVHHRRPGRSEPQNLISLCRACHVAIHFTRRPGFGFVSFRLRAQLWRELHRKQPLQLLLPLGEVAAAEQASLF